MNCCVECFDDQEIRGIIESYKNTGNCDFCGTKNVFICDVDKRTEISHCINDILNVYTVDNQLPKDFPSEKLKPIEEHLSSHWHLFKLSPEKIKELLLIMFKEKYDFEPQLFDNPVGVKEFKDPQYLESNSILRKYSWKDFVEEIKWENRFHTAHINELVLEKFFSCIVEEIKEGENFFRARICGDKRGFSSFEDIGAPPREVASAGRINSQGISLLYLADTVETALHEIRARRYDYADVGEFWAITNLNIVDLTKLDKISPSFAAYQREIDYVVQAINYDNLKVISNEIARPLRRNDSNLDYLPTQFISDFIKSKGYDGIKFQSTLHSYGYNLAIFDPSRFVCKSKKVYEINDLTFKYVAI